MPGITLESKSKKSDRCAWHHDVDAAGRGHFRDAQSLARELNKNTDRWVEMKEVLPLLSQKKHYKDLRYGYARGSEPVRYVTRIRNYDELLHRHFGKEKFDGVR